MVSNVKKYYNESVWIEWNRLVAKPYNRLEFEVTMKFIERYAAEKSVITDIGSGPGRYSIALLERGHRLSLFGEKTGIFNENEKLWGRFIDLLARTAKDQSLLGLLNTSSLSAKSGEVYFC